MFVSDNVNKSINAVDSRNLCLSYSKRESKVFALDNFNITIPVGCIYCLIGPSGCGKTTFLRSLIGLQRLDQGETRLFGYPLGHRDLAIPGHNLGYMPQDVALNDDLTIGEMINYFGRLAGVSKDKIDESKTYYLERLSIPNCGRLIGSLSGGQKRRVSFICTLVHRPKLIILDEPTVGCDPIAIEAMWSLLFKITKEQESTVILTTHYLEEARKTDTIGFMRKGVLLAQGSPAKVLDRYKVSTIEEAFTKMCKQDEIRRSLKVTSFQVKSFQVASSKSAEFPSQRVNQFRKNFFEYNRLTAAVSSRIFLRLFKMKLFVVGSFFIVCYLEFLTRFCIGGTPHSLQIGYIYGEKNQELSQLFIKSINSQVINTILYNNSDSVHQDSISGKLHGWFEISPKFTDYVTNSFAFDQPLGQPLVTYHDSTVIRPIIDTIMVTLERAYKKSTEKALSYSGSALRISESFFSIHEPLSWPADDDYFNSINYYLPRFMIFWSFIATLMSSTFTFYRDRSEAMFERNISAGVTGFQITLGHFFINALLPLINSWPVLLVIIYLLGVPCKGSILLAWTIYMVNCLTAISTAFLFGMINLDMAFVFIAVSAYIFCSFPLVGLIWPSQAIPYFFQLPRYVFPFYVHIESIVRVMAHGATLDDQTVRIGLQYSFVYICIIFIILRIKFL